MLQYTDSMCLAFLERIAKVKALEIDDLVNLAAALPDVQSTEVLNKNDDSTRRILARQQVAQAVRESKKQALSAVEPASAENGESVIDEAALSPAQLQPKKKELAAVKNLKCTVCSAKFATQEARAAHIAKRHGGSSTTGDEVVDRLLGIVRFILRIYFCHFRFTCTYIDNNTLNPTFFPASRLRRAQRRIERVSVKGSEEQLNLRLRLASERLLMTNLPRLLPCALPNCPNQMST